jgi:hypothetical protein
MPKLLDYFSSDINSVFFNTDEFAAEVIIEGKPMRVLIDEERLRDRGEKEYNGLTTGMILYFIPVSSFSNKPKVGNTQFFNGRLMYIDDVKENAGLYEIIISQNRSE